MKITKRQLKQIIKEELEEQKLNEVDMSQVQIIIDTLAQIGVNIPYAVAIGLMGYSAKQAIDHDKEMRSKFGDRRPLFGRRKKEETK